MTKKAHIAWLALLLASSNPVFAYYLSETRSQTFAAGDDDDEIAPFSSDASSSGYLFEGPNGFQPTAYAEAAAESSLATGSLKAYSYAESNFTGSFAHADSWALLREKVTFDATGVDSDWSVSLAGVLSFGDGGIEGRKTLLGSETAWVDFVGIAYINAYNDISQIYQDSGLWVIHKGPGTPATATIPAVINFAIPAEFTLVDLFINVTLHASAGACFDQTCTDVGAAPVGLANAYNTGTLSLEYTDGVTYVSESGVFLTARTGTVPEPPLVMLLMIGLASMRRTYRLANGCLNGAILYILGDRPRFSEGR